jgi:hypothetical protein
LDFPAGKEKHNIYLAGMLCSLALGGRYYFFAFACFLHHRYLNCVPWVNSSHSFRIHIACNDLLALLSMRPTKYKYLAASNKQSKARLLGTIPNATFDRR